MCVTAPWETGLAGAERVAWSVLALSFLSRGLGLERQCDHGRDICRLFAAHTTHTGIDQSGVRTAPGARLHARSFPSSALALTRGPGLTAGGCPEERGARGCPGLGQVHLRLRLFRWAPRPVGTTHPASLTPPPAGCMSTEPESGGELPWYLRPLITFPTMFAVRPLFTRRID